jgi:hypothetical protein
VGTEIYCLRLKQRSTANTKIVKLKQTALQTKAGRNKNRFRLFDNRTLKILG